MHILEYEKITIYEVESLYKELLEWSKNESELHVNMVNVHKVDFAGIQLLLAGHKSGSLKLHNVANNVLKSFEFAGVEIGLLGVENE